MTSTQLQGRTLATCIAYTEEPDGGGSICGRPASIFDIQRGGMVCGVHAPSRHMKPLGRSWRKSRTCLVTPASMPKENGPPASPTAALKFLPWP